MRVARAGFVLALSMSVLGLAMPAEAALVAYICDDVNCAGGGDAILVDNAVGDTFSAVSGKISFSGVVAGYEVTLNTSTSKPVIGSAQRPSIALSWEANNTGGGPAGPIWFYASDTDFTGIVPLKGVLNATAGTNIFGSLHGGSSNLNLDLTTTLDSKGPFNASTGDVPFSTGIVGSVVNPYSLTIGVQSSGNDLRGDFTLQAPEPATLSLFGLGLLGLANVARRRMRRQ